MREIKFRGKCIESSEWVDGSLLRNFFYKSELGEEIVYIANPDFFPDYDSFEDMENSVKEVYADSVGQYTGLKDKNGKEIYEGDIIQKNIQLKGINPFSITKEVAFHKGAFGAKINGDVVDNLEIKHTRNYEVIGNIYEDKHLLEDSK